MPSARTVTEPVAARGAWSGCNEPCATTGCVEEWRASNADLRRALPARSRRRPTPARCPGGEFARRFAVPRHAQTAGSGAAGPAPGARTRAPMGPLHRWSWRSIIGTSRRGNKFPIGAGSRGECPVRDDEVDELPGARLASPEMPPSGDGGASAHLAGDQSAEIGGRVPARRVVAHESSPPATIAASRRMPRAMRAFTVPMGMPNLVAISCWVRSPK